MANLSHKEYIRRWLPQLVALTSRSAHSLVDEGLLFGDFWPQGVRIEFEDDSVADFRWACYVTCPRRKDVVAVFTEHCGYHEFSLGPDGRVFRRTAD